MNELKTSVSARVAQLRSLPIKEIWALWDRYFPRRPDKPNREYLQSRLAYKLQEEVFGGLPIETARRLANIGDQAGGQRPLRRDGGLSGQCEGN